MQNFEKNWKTSVCIRVDSFAKSVNLEGVEISRESSQRKKIEIMQVNFSVIHPTHITT